jgi:hypothetical protein
MTRLKILLFLLFNSCLFACTSTEEYKKDLSSENIDKIDQACYELGKAHDTSAIKPLLVKALDPRMTTDLRFYGMTVNYCRLTALSKITGEDVIRPFDKFKVDTAATLFYLNWAIKHGHIKDTNSVDIYYYK